jgi:hypothetical protein
MAVPFTEPSALSTELSRFAGGFSSPPGDDLSRSGDEKTFLRLRRTNHDV